MVHTDDIVVQLLVQRRSDKQRVVSKTMALRAKLNKLGVVMRERQTKVDEQIAEIDKHNAIINTTEKEMIRLRKQYEVHSFLRKYQRSATAALHQGKWCQHRGTDCVEAHVLAAACGVHVFAGHVAESRIRQPST